jgi:hypothetical protein
MNRANVASFPLKDSIKDFEATFVLLASDQPPELRF